MSIAAAERLHVLAHRAAIDGQDVDDWWGSPIDTALAAVTFARHTNAHRDRAEAALARLLRWWRDGSPRRVSGDVVALALTARAAAELQRAEPELTEAAVEAVADLAGRDSSIVPELHLALAAWALSSLVPERGRAPWPALRGRLDRPRLGGVDEPLRRFGLGLARDPLDPNVLVRDLVGETGSAPGLSESAILLWAISMAAQELALHLSHEDNGLQLLLIRRAEMAERLVGEIDERTFFEPDMQGFDSSLDALPVSGYLSVFEALLLDLALSSREDGEPWLTFAEAESLFGARATAARLDVKATRRRLLGWSALLVAVVAGLGGVSFWLAARELDVESAIANSGAVAVTGFVLVPAFAVFGRGHPNSRLVEALGVFSGFVALCMALVAINQLPEKPYISDATGLVVSILIGAAATILFLLWSWLLRERKPSVR